MNEFILVIGLLAGVHALAQNQPMPFQIVDPPSADELMLAPLLDTRNGGQATGAAQGKPAAPGKIATLGGLVNGTLLPQSGVGYIAGRGETDRYAAGIMASFLINSAPSVLAKFPQTLLRIGGIAQQLGGPYQPHSSHQNGLDADIQFVGTTTYESVLDKDGVVTPRFNVEQNWFYWRLATMQQLKVDGQVTSAVSMILVDPRIKTYLCAWAKAREATLDPLDYEVLTKLRPTAGHDDHFHLRLRCSPHYASCIGERVSTGKKPTGCSEFDGAPKQALAKRT
jgi:penicillin-insensitive murein endopeptidase